MLRFLLVSILKVLISTFKLYFGSTRTRPERFVLDCTGVLTSGNVFFTSKKIGAVDLSYGVPFERNEALKGRKDQRFGT